MVDGSALTLLRRNLLVSLLIFVVYDPAYMTSTRANTDTQIRCDAHDAGRRFTDRNGGGDARQRVPRRPQQPIDAAAEREPESQAGPGGGGRDASAVAHADRACPLMYDYCYRASLFSKRLDRLKRIHRPRMAALNLKHWLLLIST